MTHRSWIMDIDYETAEKGRGKRGKEWRAAAETMMAGNMEFARWKSFNLGYYILSALFLFCSLWALANELRGMEEGPFVHNLYDSLWLFGLSIWTWYCGRRRYTRYCANIVLEAEIKERAKSLP
jgi:hypothetical protein